MRKPAQRPPPDEHVQATPERLARGKYLVENVCDCLGCHSDHFWDRFGIPIKRGTEGQGGFTFDEKLSIPGEVSAQNITQDNPTPSGCAARRWRTWRAGRASGA